VTEKLPDLSRLEIQCLRLLWKRKKASVREIQSDIGDSAGYSTIRKIIERLEEKGAVERAGRQGKALLYRSRVSQTEMMRKEVGRFLDTMFDGSAISLMSQLVDMESVTATDLEQLQQYLDSEEEETP
jgi:BlaI family transcriptional regulator, penicillinase repressor